MTIFGNTIFGNCADLIPYLETVLISKRDRFPSLLRFLLEQKQAIEYENAELRSNSNLAVKGSLHYLEKKDNKIAIPEGQGTSRYKRNKCLYHEGANHWTDAGGVGHGLCDSIRPIICCLSWSNGGHIFSLRMERGLSFLDRFLH